MTPANIPNLRLRMAIPNLRLRMALLDLQPSEAGFEVMRAIPPAIDPLLLILA